jgi:hypothetical protein
MGSSLANVHRNHKSPSVERRSPHITRSHAEITHQASLSPMGTPLCGQIVIMGITLVPPWPLAEVGLISDKAAAGSWSEVRGLRPNQDETPNHLGSVYQVPYEAFS